MKVRHILTFVDLIRGLPNKCPQCRKLHRLQCIFTFTRKILSLLVKIFFIRLVSFERYINNAINKMFVEIFRLFIFHIQQFKTVGKFEKIIFPLATMVTLPKKKKTTTTVKLNNLTFS